jgi:transketolase
MKLYYVGKSELDKIIRSGDLDVLTDSLRLNLIFMIQNAGSGHLGGSLSSLDIMVPLFWGGMGPEDVFISSKGHDAPALYACMQAKGVIPFETIHTLRRPGGLPGHPTIDVPGVLFNTGSLGMGISKANGLAAADRLAGRKRRIHVLVGDGEFQEGQNWEPFTHIEPAVVLHVDCNGFSLSQKLAINERFRIPTEWCFHKTVKGSGVSFMEGNNAYHAGALSEDEYMLAVGEIRARIPDVRLEQAEKRPYVRACDVFTLAKGYPYILKEVGVNKRVVVMDADLEPDCGLTAFKQAYPDRFIQCGIAEQDMVSMATGLAAGGFIPVVHSFAAFLCRRANEQIYNACLERRHIVFVGAMAGMLPTGPGTSHECMEDVALMKTMPGMTVMAPDTPDRLRATMEWAVNEATGPVYVSIQCWEMEGVRR